MAEVARAGGLLNCSMRRPDFRDFQAIHNREREDYNDVFIPAYKYLPPILNTLTKTILILRQMHRINLDGTLFPLEKLALQPKYTTSGSNDPKLCELARMDSSTSAVADIGEID